jgi:hypothetical protein
MIQSYPVALTDNLKDHAVLAAAKHNPTTHKRFAGKSACSRVKPATKSTLQPSLARQRRRHAVVTSQPVVMLCNTPYDDRMVL